MAPSFDIGNPQRSLVRIPGSGQDRTLNLKPICLDVAQISNFSKNLNEIMPFKFDWCDYSQGSTTIVLPPGLHSRAETSQQVSSTTEENNKSTSRKRSSEEGQDRTSKRPTKDPSSDLSNATLNGTERIAKMKKLEDEKKQLQADVEELYKKVCTFKYILKSRKRLDAFLKALDEPALGLDNLREAFKSTSTESNKCAERIKC